MINDAYAFQRLMSACLDSLCHVCMFIVFAWSVFLLYCSPVWEIASFLKFYLCHTFLGEVKMVLIMTIQSYHITLALNVSDVYFFHGVGGFRRAFGLEIFNAVWHHCSVAVCSFHTVYKSTANREQGLCCFFITTFK